jgi:hypothetical protein
VSVVKRQPKVPIDVRRTQLREWTDRIEQADDATGPSLRDQISELGEGAYEDAHFRVAEAMK